MARRKRKAIPIMLLWDRKSQERFITSVERLTSLVNDLDVLLAAKKRRSAAAAKANHTRQQTAAQAAQVDGEKGGELDPS